MAVAQPTTAMAPLLVLKAWLGKTVGEVAEDQRDRNNSQGPLARAALCVFRVGWAIGSSAIWRDHRGAQVPLEQMSPGVLEDLR
eukprot:641647-Pyramimonas_sp.AAC.1